MPLTVTVTAPPATVPSTVGLRELLLGAHRAAPASAGPAGAGRSCRSRRLRGRRRGSGSSSCLSRLVQSVCRQLGWSVVRDLLDHLGAELALEQLGAGEAVVLGVGVVAVGVGVGLLRRSSGLRGCRRAAGRPGGRDRRRAAGCGPPRAAGGCRRAGGAAASDAGRLGRRGGLRGCSTRPGAPRRRPSGWAPGSTIASTRQSAPTTSIAAWRRISSLPPPTNDSRAPALVKPRVRRGGVDADDLGVLGEVDPGDPAPSLVASTMSGQSRRTSTRQGADPRSRLGRWAGGRRLAGRVGSRRAASGAAAAGRGPRGRRLGPGSASGRRWRRCGSRCGRPRADRAAGAAWRRRSSAAAGRRGARRTADDRDPPLEPVEPGAEPVGESSSAPGSSTRAQISSSSSRGAVAPAHLGEAGRDDVGGAAELGPAEPGGLGDQPLALVLGDVDQPGGGGVGDGGDDHQVAQPAEQVLGEAARVLAGLDHLVDDPEDRRAVAGRERVDDLVEQVVGGVAEQAGGEVVGHPVGAGTAEQLVEHREGVAGRAGARAYDQRQRRRLDRDALLLAQLGEVGRTAAAAGSAGTGSGGCASGWSG